MTTTAAATQLEGRREVSRGHSSRRKKKVDEGLNQLQQGTDRDISMDMERQKQAIYQLDLFGGKPKFVGHGTGGEGGTRATVREALQVAAAMERKRALTEDLMKRVTRLYNLNKAWKRVKANKGAPGIDGMTVDELREWLSTHKEELVESLMNGSYRPQPVRGVKIPKPGGGMRQLGIPTVVDRLVQQAILQVLEPVLDPTFSQSSFGFRPKRSAHDALKRARKYVGEGRTIVVDMDMEKFFDRVNHDVLMARLARHVEDKCLLRIIRRFLEAGILQDGVCTPRYEGTPQGGPLSPLLANLLLDDLDKELEQRGHCFCRYADDCNIYVRTMEAGQRVIKSITRFLEEKLHLKVNTEKSAVAPVWERKFLGYRLLHTGDLGIAPPSIVRFKERIRQITRRNRSVRLVDMIGEMNSLTTGWVMYFRLARCKGHLGKLDAWIRRKLRCFRLKQCKRVKTIAAFFEALGVPEWRAWIGALSGKGWWRLAGSPQASEAMSLDWFLKQGLVSLSKRYLTVKR